MNFTACLGFTLHEEGGFQAMPADRGNWLGDVLVGTCLGISAPVLALWLREHRNITDPKVVAQVMRNLPPDMPVAIYRQKYWNAVQGDRLPAGVDLMVFDHAVNAGVGASVLLLQRILGVEADGALGPVTLDATLRHWPGGLIGELAAAQGAAYRAMKDFALFGADWLGRLDRRRDAAYALHGAALTREGDGH